MVRLPLLAPQCHAAEPTTPRQSRRQIRQESRASRAMAKRRGGGVTACSSSAVKAPKVIAPSAVKERVVELAKKAGIEQKDVKSLVTWISVSFDQAESVVTSMDEISITC